MQQRRLGRTGLQVSEFTLGGGIVGGILINEADEVRLEALDRVIAAGCNWIDTAADYGKGESERGLGRLLPGHRPQAPASRPRSGSTPRHWAIWRARSAARWRKA